MRRVLLDVNVLLDVLADRQPFADEAQAVLGAVEREEVEGWVAAHTITTLHYLLTRHHGPRRASRVVSDLLRILRVAAVDGERLRQALAFGWSDFEDAVQAACAEAEGAEALVTRDRDGFREATVRIVSPGELLARLG